MDVLSPAIITREGSAAAVTMGTLSLRMDWTVSVSIHSIYIRNMFLAGGIIITFTHTKT